MAHDFKTLPDDRKIAFIEDGLREATAWAASQPNDAVLWTSLRAAAGGFLHALFKLGAFAGANPQEAYFVTCDATTTSAQDIEDGVVNIQVGYSPLYPAEFVVIMLQQRAGSGGG